MGPSSKDRVMGRSTVSVLQASSLQLPATEHQSREVHHGWVDSPQSASDPGGSTEGISQTENWALPE